MNNIRLEAASYDVIAAERSPLDDFIGAPPVVTIPLDYCNLEGGSCDGEGVLYETTVDGYTATIRYLKEEALYRESPSLFVFWPKIEGCSISLERACNRIMKNTMRVSGDGSISDEPTPSPTGCGERQLS